MAPVNPNKSKWGEQMFKFQQRAANDLLGSFFKDDPGVVSFAFAPDDIIDFYYGKAVYFW